MKFLSSKSIRVSKWHLKSYRRCVERMKPFLQLFKLCGMFANKIVEGRLKCCSLPFYSICVLWVSCYVSYTCYLLYYFVRIDSIKLRTTVDFVKHLIGYVSLSVDVVVAYSSQDHFIKFFDRLESYDYEVVRMKNGRKDNIWVPWIATCLMIILNLSLVSVIVIDTSTGIIFSVTISDICTSIVHIFGTLEKFLMLYLMLERFKHLNKKIVPNVSWDERWPNTIRISDVKILHSMLYDAQRAFDDIYSNSLLISFASLMIHIVANVRTFRERTLLIAYAFLAPPILQVLILCVICHYTAEEANKIACVLSEDMCTFVSSRQTMAKIDVYTYFLHNRVSFEAAGFFTINLPLFQSIVAAVTTYFIILI